MNKFFKLSILHVTLIASVISCRTDCKAQAASSTKIVCALDSTAARKHIKSGKISFLIRGGIAKTILPGQAEFEKKYHLNYTGQGCVGLHTDCMASYNRVVAKYLDKKYGTGWRKSVRQDVAGIN